jgi:protein KIBRA
MYVNKDFIEQGLATIEEQTAPGQLESDKDRLLLIQEKEQLLRELRSITPNSRPEPEMRQVALEIEKLERDLNNAMEISNRCIADRCPPLKRVDPLKSWELR